MLRARSNVKRKRKCVHAALCWNYTAFSHIFLCLRRSMRFSLLNFVFIFFDRASCSNKRDSPHTHTHTCARTPPRKYPSAELHTQPHTHTRAYCERKLAQRSRRHICSIVTFYAYGERVCGVCRFKLSWRTHRTLSVHTHTHTIKYATLLSIISHLDSATVDFGWREANWWSHSLVVWERMGKCEFCVVCHSCCMATSHIHVPHRDNNKANEITIVRTYIMILYTHGNRETVTASSSVSMQDQIEHTSKR